MRHADDLNIFDRELAQARAVLEITLMMKAYLTWKNIWNKAKSILSFFQAYFTMFWFWLLKFYNNL